MPGMTAPREVLGAVKQMKKLVRIAGAPIAACFAIACEPTIENPEAVIEEEADAAVISTASPANQAVADSVITLEEENKRTASAYQISWAQERARCEDILTILNSANNNDISKTDYARAQIQERLETRASVEWRQESADLDSVSVDIFNENRSRAVERRFGNLSNSRIAGLWVSSEASGFERLDYSYAADLTPDYPAPDGLQTKLAFSVADIISAGGQYYTLVSPLRDFDAGLNVYVINWKRKTSASANPEPQDYYATIECAYVQSTDLSEASETP